MSGSWEVHKFGGSSLADAGRFRQVEGILRAEAAGKKAVVVSAMQRVTDGLIELAELAQARDESCLARIEGLRTQHLETAAALLAPNESVQFAAVLESNLQDLREILRGVFLSRTCSERTLDLIAGYGELWSAQLLQAHLGALATWLDARSVLVVDPGDNLVSVDWERSQALVSASLENLEADLVVITGFIAATPDGIPTTLKRNGSDFSASIFGRLLAAATITIWTDVDGVLSADPRLVPEAVMLAEVSYAEARAGLLRRQNGASEHDGAGDRKPDSDLDSEHAQSRSARHKNQRTRRFVGAVKGFATVDGIALVNVEGTGMIGVPGVVISTRRRWAPGCRSSTRCAIWCKPGTRFCGLKACSRGRSPTFSTPSTARSRSPGSLGRRDDLSGMDVGRKLVILAREMGLAVELENVQIQSLVPATLRAGSVEEFLARLPEHHTAMSKLLEAARSRGEVLRYVGTIDPEGSCAVAFRSYPRTHAFAGTSGSDNIVAFTTERYRTQSLIVQGPGAGPEVTAGGVFADLLRLASYLGGTGG